MGTSQHQRTLSQGHSYPSTSSPLSPDVISPNRSPPPHPYTLGATRSPIAGVFDKERAVENHDSRQHGQSEDEKQESVQIVGQQEHLPPPRTSRRMSVTATLPLPEPLRLGTVPIFLLYLPLPPLLSMIYMVCGHAILRQASPASIYNAPITTSLEAGATGGIIIAIPFAIIIYFLLLFPTRPSTAPEDFFEDDTSSTVARQRWMHNLGICVSALFAICVGGLSGPLGVVCLSHGSLGTFVEAQRILSPSSAVAAGFLGGGVVGLGIFFLCTSLCIVRKLWMEVP
ncbi:hypothetical protein D9619_008766 [Psilocybe cf. subviscida]|uniref:Uncharacterized protein n=1 Tax=Psilocybe cf. subviscida TaxID=2480587 RepID=A0A8H5B9J3_9AGAR|nr:hypothetical protein D9619_008766 [Psilocybe cf. subviscida]